MIDSHIHINARVLSDSNYYIDRINKNNKIEKVINVGLDIETSIESVKISNSNNKLYSAIGVHPLYIDKIDINKMYNMVTNKVIAIGEIGLDDATNNLDEQRKYLIRQIIIANELRLPVIIHSNNTNAEVIRIFKNVVKPEYGCVFHCFQPDLGVLNYCIANDMFISFAGRITYKTAKKSIEIAKLVPNDLFLIETDSPYISPEPFRGCINESSNIIYTANKISEIKDMSVDEIDSITTQNTKRLFKRMM